LNGAGNRRAQRLQVHTRKVESFLSRFENEPVLVQDTNRQSAVTRVGSPSTATAAPIRARSARVFGDPIAQLQVFPYFAPFVSVFFRFVWPVIDLSEGVFGVANYVRDYIECLRHGSDPLLCILQTALSEKSANHPENSLVAVLMLPSRLAKLPQHNPTGSIVKCSTSREKFLFMLGEFGQRKPSEPRS